MKKKYRQPKNYKHRLYIFKSNKHIYAQVINDQNNTTIITSSSICAKFKPQITSSATCETAKLIGEDIANKLKNKGITEIILDRGKKLYHGKIKALAETTRNEGIKI